MTSTIPLVTFGSAVCNFLISNIHLVDGVPSLNNSKVGDYVNPIYSMELEINDTTCTVIPVSYQKLPKMVG
jgi:hypothetical protein